MYNPYALPGPRELHAPNAVLAQPPLRRNSLRQSVPIAQGARSSRANTLEGFINDPEYEREVVESVFPPSAPSSEASSDILDELQAELIANDEGLETTPIVNPLPPRRLPPRPLVPPAVAQLALPAAAPSAAPAPQWVQRARQQFVEAPITPLSAVTITGAPLALDPMPSAPPEPPDNAFNKFRMRTSHSDGGLLLPSQRATVGRLGGLPSRAAQDSSNISRGHRESHRESSARPNLFWPARRHYRDRKW